MATETKCEYYPLVPKSLTENIAFRRELLRMGAEGTAHDRQELWTMCSRDILFWWNTFAWTYDSRLQEGMREIPFITYPFQDDAILAIDDAITIGEDIVTEKSRDMGATWMGIGVPVWRCLFKSGESHLMVSRKEGLVDSSGNPDTLFWKVDFLLEHLPEWMRPRPPERTHLHIGFPETRSIIDGESTTGDLGRGGRRTHILLDEFAAVENGRRVLAATRDNTNSRHLASTPQGMSNAYAIMAHDGTTRKLRLHWSEHPEKRRGLYESQSGKLVILDEGYDFPEDYKFIRDGKLRSVWYDKQCLRAGDKHEIAQELDIDYMGSAYQYFDPESIQRHIDEFAIEPYIRAEISYDESGSFLEYTPNEKGSLLLWIMPDVSGKIPENDVFVAGADISAGTGASNSAVSFWSMRKREKVAEFVTPDMTPTEFAYAVHALLKWFKGTTGGARVIWEANGVGQSFGKVLTDKCGYRNIWYMRDEKKIAPRPGDKPGWTAVPTTKNTVLEAYRHLIGSRTIANRSKIALEETLYYVHSGNAIEHSKAMESADPSGAKDNHGDRVIADAIVTTKLLGSPRRDIDREEPEFMAAPPADSMAGRRKARQQAALAAEMW